MSKVLYFESFIVVEPGLTTLKKGQLLSEEALTKAQDEFGKAVRNKKIHHAWLLTGPKGIGKATLAWKMAHYLLSLSSNDALNSEISSFKQLNIQQDDPISKRISALSEPKLKLLRKTWDPKTEKFRQSISIDDVRGIKQFFNLSSTDDGQRVVIIDSADDLQNASANALLKILEEPPKRTIILIISHNPNTLLPTIKSRCRKLNLLPLNNEDLKLGLSQAIGPDDPVGDDIYALSEGSIGNAITLLNNNEKLFNLIINQPKINKRFNDENYILKAKHFLQYKFDE